MTPQAAGLSVTELSSGYGAIRVVDNVSFDVAPGQAIAIVGANGAGKTTLLRTLSGLIRPMSGSVYMNGQLITGRRAHNVARLGIGHIPEGRQILQHLTVRENLLLGCRDIKAREARLEKQLDTFTILRGKLDQPGGQLSGGQQQMLAIARTMMGNPRVVLLDEPTLGLSPKLTDDLCDLLVRVRKEAGATFILVEQNIALAAELTEHAILLQRGRVTRIADSKTLMSDPTLLRAYLG